MKSKSICVGTRSIKATWTREMSQDLQSYHGLDVEKELEKVLQEELKENELKENARKKREMREKKLKRIFKDEID